MEATRSPHAPLEMYASDLPHGKLRFTQGRCKSNILYHSEAYQNPPPRLCRLSKRASFRNDPLEVSVARMRHLM